MEVFKITQRGHRGGSVFHTHPGGDAAATRRWELLPRPSSLQNPDKMPRPTPTPLLNLGRRYTKKILLSASEHQHIWTTNTPTKMAANTNTLGQRCPASTSSSILGILPDVYNTQETKWRESSHQKYGLQIKQYRDYFPRRRDRPILYMTASAQVWFKGYKIVL